MFVCACWRVLLRDGDGPEFITPTDHSVIRNAWGVCLKCMFVRACVLREVAMGVCCSFGRFFHDNQLE